MITQQDIEDMEQRLCEMREQFAEQQEPLDPGLTRQEIGYMQNEIDDLKIKVAWLNEKLARFAYTLAPDAAKQNGISEWIPF